MARYLYSELSNLLTELKRCNANTNEPFNSHMERLERLVSDHMPSGSGFDSGTKLDLDSSHAEKLVFTTSFHHMNEAGMYCGWTEHVVTVTPSLLHRYHLRISGRNRNDIKEYMHKEFSSALDTDVELGVTA